MVEPEKYRKMLPDMSEEEILSSLMQERQENEALSNKLGFDPYYSSARNVTRCNSFTELMNTVNAHMQAYEPLNSSVFVRMFDAKALTGLLISEVQFQGVYSKIAPKTMVIPPTPIRGAEPDRLKDFCFGYLPGCQKLGHLGNVPHETNIKDVYDFECEWIYDQEVKTIKYKEIIKEERPDVYEKYAALIK